MRKLVEFAELPLSKSGVFPGRSQLWIFLILLELILALARHDALSLEFFTHIVIREEIDDDDISQHDRGKKEVQASRKEESLSEFLT